VQSVLPLPWKEASAEAVNAIAYATRYHSDWFWKGAQHIRKWRDGALALRQFACAGQRNWRRTTGGGYGAFHSSVRARGNSPWVAARTTRHPATSSIMVRHRTALAGRPYLIRRGTGSVAAERIFYSPSRAAEAYGIGGQESCHQEVTRPEANSTYACAQSEVSPAPLVGCPCLRACSRTAHLGLRLSRDRSRYS
jgi:hypothetical protein